MAPSPSAERLLDDACGERLLDIASEVIRAGLQGRRPELPPLAEVPPPLHEPAPGVFVTLHVGGELQGCIGDVGSGEPLAWAVAGAARSAAFADPRFAPLTAAQLPALDIEVSVLSPREPLPAGTADELLAALRPHVDGLVIEAGVQRALFLPDVWAELPEPARFVEQLFRKARLSPRPWPTGLRAWRFTTQAWHRTR
jgi:AmmeMemoRadiSam system protein A